MVYGKGMVKILALDLATKTGWAIWEDGYITDSGTANFTLKKDDHYYQRYVMFNKFLGEHKHSHEILFEFPGFLKHLAYQRSFFGMLGVLELFTGTHGIDQEHITPKALKLGFCGSGNATKEDMCAKAHSYGWINGELGTKKDNDEADAIGILYAILLKRGLQVEYDG